MYNTKLFFDSTQIEFGKNLSILYISAFKQIVSTSLYSSNSESFSKMIISPKFVAHKKFWFFIWNKQLIIAFGWFLFISISSSKKKFFWL